MCGGCGSRDDVDWLSPLVAGRPARAGAAAAASSLSRAAGLRVTVSACPGGWMLRSPTGRAALAGTLTRLWDTVAAWHGGLPHVDRPHVDRPEVDRPEVDRPEVDRPEVDRPAAGTSASGLPAPARRVAILVGTPGDAASGASGWTGLDLRRCPADAIPAALDDVSDDAERLLLICPDAALARRALGVVTAAGALRRRTVTALIREGEGPAWLDDVGALDPAALLTVLDGAVGDAGEVLYCAPDDLPALACWAASQVAAGALAGRRLRVVADTRAGRVVLDAADGLGVSARAEVPASRVGQHAWASRLELSASGTRPRFDTRPGSDEIPQTATAHRARPGAQR